MALDQRNFGMRKKGKNVTDLMREAIISYPTALRLSKGLGNAITFEVLEALCNMLNVEVKDILEHIPEK